MVLPHAAAQGLPRDLQVWLTLAATLPPGIASSLAADYQHSSQHQGITDDVRRCRADRAAYWQSIADARTGNTEGTSQ